MRDGALSVAVAFPRARARGLIEATSRCLRKIGALRHAGPRGNVLDSHISLRPSLMPSLRNFAQLSETSGLPLSFPTCAILDRKRYARRAVHSNADQTTRR